MATSVRERAGARWALVAAGVLVLGAIALAAYPYGETKDPNELSASRTYELRGAWLRAGATFSADPALQARSSPLLVVTPAAAGSSEARVLVGARVRATQRLSLRAGAGAAALTRWDGDAVAVARVTPSARSVAVSVASLDSGRRLADADVAVPGPRGAAVDAQLAPWGGRPDDLFAVVWPRRNDLRPGQRATGVQPLPRLEVLRADEGWRRPALTAGLPVPSEAPADWTILVARVSGSLPDLVLVRHSAGRQPEVHVLSGESGFRQFMLHQRLDLPAADARRAAYVAVLEAGRPALQVIEPAAGHASVRVFPLGAAPSGT
ncbi:MAG: hypothetical protein JSS99_04915 [Actinobacteria bacterium]|nr:hypothetical protein [Actinomycetota bacterium]